LSLEEAEEVEVDAEAELVEQVELRHSHQVKHSPLPPQEAPEDTQEEATKPDAMAQQGSQPAITHQVETPRRTSTTRQAIPDKVEKSKSLIVT
jgi:hypothetical protein